MTFVRNGNRLGVNREMTYAPVEAVAVPEGVAAPPAPPAATLTGEPGVGGTLPDGETDPDTGEPEPEEPLPGEPEPEEPVPGEPEPEEPVPGEPELDPELGVPVEPAAGTGEAVTVK